MFTETKPARYWRHNNEILAYELALKHGLHIGDMELALALALKHGLHVGDVALASKGRLAEVLDLPCLRVQLRRNIFV